MLKEKYPTVNFVWANKAIGGFTSPALTRTAWSDLFPYYPDLLFFHVHFPCHPIRISPNHILNDV